MLPLRRVLAAAARPSTLRASKSTVPCATWRTRTAIKTYSTAAEEKIEEKASVEVPTEATPVTHVETPEQATPADTTEAPTSGLSQDKPANKKVSEEPSNTPTEAAPRKWSFVELAAERKALRAQVAKEKTNGKTAKTATSAAAADRKAATARIAAKSQAATKASAKAAAASSPLTTTPKTTPARATPSQPTPKSSSSSSQPTIQETLRLRPDFLPTFNPKSSFKFNDLSETDWQTSYKGISERPVYEEAADVLLRPLAEEDVEVKPDGIIYLPEIKYRRRLTEAFGPMGWGLIPRGEPVVGDHIVTREYCLIVDGRFVAQAQGENQYFGNDQLPSAVEGCKSNALMRCCKDLGIASELWDPSYIRWFRQNHMESRWVENTVNKKKKQFWFKKGVVEVPYPWKVTK